MGFLYPFFLPFFLIFLKLYYQFTHLIMLFCSTSVKLAFLSLQLGQRSDV